MHLKFYYLNWIQYQLIRVLIHFNIILNWAQFILRFQSILRFFNVCSILKNKGVNHDLFLYLLGFIYRFVTFLKKKYLELKLKIVVIKVKQQYIKIVEIKPVKLYGSLTQSNFQPIEIQPFRNPKLDSHACSDPSVSFSIRFLDT